jgi:hypothetical protein
MSRSANFRGETWRVHPYDKSGESLFIEPHEDSPMHHDYGSDLQGALGHVSRKGTAWRYDDGQFKKAKIDHYAVREGWGRGDRYPAGWTPGDPRPERE